MENRRLTRTEFNSLLETAPDTETRNLKQFLNGVKYDGYDFFERFAIKQSGIVNGRPLYFAALTKSNDGAFEFWTVVNKDVKETFSLCKYSKRFLKEASKKYGDLYATMENINDTNIKWCLWLGFNIIISDDKMITLCYKGE